MVGVVNPLAIEYLVLQYLLLALHGSRQHLHQPETILLGPADLERLSCIRIVQCLPQFLHGENGAQGQGVRGWQVDARDGALFLLPKLCDRGFEVQRDAVDLVVGGSHKYLTHHC